MGIALIILAIIIVITAIVLIKKGAKSTNNKFKAGSEMPDKYQPKGKE